MGSAFEPVVGCITPLLESFKDDAEAPRVCLLSKSTRPSTMAALERTAEEAYSQEQRFTGTAPDLFASVWFGPMGVPTKPS
jgi:hypothetical protein